MEHLNAGRRLTAMLSRTALVMIAALLFTACSGSNDEPQFEGTTVDTGPFTTTLPDGWTFAPMQGVDSFVGEFNGRGVRILFDYGWYSSDLREYIDDPAYTHTDESIDGLDAEVVTPSSDQAGVTAASIVVGDVEESGMQTTILLYAENVPADARDDVLQIYRSLRFEEEE